MSDIVSVNYIIFGLISGIAVTMCIMNFISEIWFYRLKKKGTLQSKQWTFTATRRLQV